jgi:hypothetical protein
VGVIVDKVIKFQIPSDAGNFLTRLSTVIFWIMTELQGSRWIDSVEFTSCWTLQNSKTTVVRRWNFQILTLREKLSTRTVHNSEISPISFITHLLYWQTCLDVKNFEHKNVFILATCYWQRHRGVHR